MRSASSTLAFACARLYAVSPTRSAGLAAATLINPYFMPCPPPVVSFSSILSLSRARVNKKCRRTEIVRLQWLLCRYSFTLPMDTPSTI